MKKLSDFSFILSIGEFEKIMNKKKELNSKSQSTNGICRKVKIFPNRSGWPKWNAWCIINHKTNVFISFIVLYRLTCFIYLSSLAWAGWLCCLAGLNFSIKVPRAADLIFKTQSPPDRKKMFDWFKPNQDIFTKKENLFTATNRIGSKKTILILDNLIECAYQRECLIGWDPSIYGYR